MTLTYRVGTLQDTGPTFDVLVAALADLDRRAGTAELRKAWTDPAFVRQYWAQRRPLLEHLARTADRFWLAEREGQVVGYARSIRNDGVRELTEFFVLPGSQGEGVGRELLDRAFPHDATGRRIVIASTDLPALARYLKAGVSPRVSIYPMSGTPQAAVVPTDLAFALAEPGPTTLAAIREIDRAVLGFTRDPDHAFLMSDRRVYLYRRGDRVIGYGYVGTSTGPIALLDPAAFPAVLAHAETEAAKQAEPAFRVIVPLVNRIVVDYLLGRRLRLDAFPMVLMSDEPVGDFTRYVGTNPPVFL